MTLNFFSCFSRAILDRKARFRTIKFIKKNNLPETTKLHGNPIIIKHEKAKLFLGEKVTLCSDSKYTALGVNHPVVIRLLTEFSVIRIGSNTGISGGSFVAAKSITIGGNCLFGANVSVADTDFHLINSTNRRQKTDWEKVSCVPISIGNNVFIGTNCIILKGVSIGDNSVVGAGSVVTKSIPAGQIWAGNPAKFISTVEL